jgi:hypothetical protein
MTSDNLQQHLSTDSLLVSWFRIMKFAGPTPWFLSTRATFVTLLDTLVFLGG